MNSSLLWAVCYSFFKLGDCTAWIKLDNGYLTKDFFQTNNLTLLEHSSLPKRKGKKETRKESQEKKKEGLYQPLFLTTYVLTSQTCFHNLKNVVVKLNFAFSCLWKRLLLFEDIETTFIKAFHQLAVPRETKQKNKSLKTLLYVQILNRGTPADKHTPSIRFPLWGEKEEINLTFLPGN